MKKSTLIIIFIISATSSFFIEKYFFYSLLPETDAQNITASQKVVKPKESLENQQKTSDLSKEKQFLTEEEYQAISQQKEKNKSLENKRVNKNKTNKEDSPIKKAIEVYNEPIIYPVFFTSQAPSGQWHNEIFQDGCEEASTLMAINWAMKNNRPLSTKEMEKEILALSNFENKNYGFYLDVSLADVYKTIQDYYHYKNIKFLEEVTKKDLINALYQSAVVIVPADGRLLGNPFFVPPGPAYHTLLIVGYDPIKKVFIVNDPGTRRGDHYHYGEDVLYKAIRDYPSGYHKTVKENHKRAIIVYK